MADDQIPHSRPIVTRAEAKVSGAKRYFTGKPCPNGHLSLRFTADAKCMECNRSIVRKWQDANRAKCRETCKNYYWQNLDKYAAYRDANKDRIRAAGKANKLLHKERIKVKRKAWWRANPDKVSEHNRNRKALRKGAVGKHTIEDLSRIRKSQKDRCALCRAKLSGGGHVDHIKPLNDGGSNWPSNLQILCVRCNCTKRDEDQIDFMRRNGFLL